MHHSSTSNSFITQHFLLISPSSLHFSNFHHLSSLHFHTYSFLPLLSTFQMNQLLTLSVEHLLPPSCKPHSVTPLVTHPNTPSSYHNQLTNTLHSFHPWFSINSYILPMPHHQLTRTFINSLRCNLILHNITFNYTSLLSISLPSLQVCCNTQTQ